MERPSRIDVLVKMAEAQSLRSTCGRLQVGAVVHRAGRILTTGYNGAPAGIPHCDHTCDCITEEATNFGREVVKVIHEPGCATKRACLTAAHAERNAIDWAARHGIRLEGAELVTTDTPCYQCAGSIINAGIVGVISVRDYRDPAGANMLRQGGVSMNLYGDMIR